MAGEFEIFRSRHNANHYVAVSAADKSTNATRVRTSQNLSIFTSIADDGTHHLGFDPVAAKAAINRERRIRLIYPCPNVWRR